MIAPALIALPQHGHVIMSGMCFPPRSTCHGRVVESEHHSAAAESGVFGRGRATGNAPQKALAGSSRWQDGADLPLWSFREYLEVKVARRDLRDAAATSARDDLTPPKGPWVGREIGGVVGGLWRGLAALRGRGTVPEGACGLP